MNNATLKEFLIEKALHDDQATHVVVGIEWGANVVVDFSATTSDVKTARSSSGELAEAVAKAAEQLNEGLEGGSVTNTNDTFFDDFTFDITGDVIPPNGKPQSINEALDFLKQVSKSIF